jgi:hypothetical protein
MRPIEAANAMREKFLEQDETSIAVLASPRAAKALAEDGGLDGIATEVLGMKVFVSMKMKPGHFMLVPHDKAEEWQRLGLL